MSSGGVPPTITRVSPDANTVPAHDPDRTITSLEDGIEGTLTTGSVPPHYPQFQTGEILAETYEIRGLLGRGGMGQVYDAWDRELHRRVAIKTARTGSIATEARALAAMRHASLVTVHALGKHGDMPFMVMEHVSGVTLAAQLEKRRLGGDSMSIEEALDILLGIAEGLAAVHRAGVAHRDLTPANVMLAAGSRVVVTDFGLVQPEFSAEEVRFGGTPAYMAPESFTNDLAPGDAHFVDVYALGIIAFEMLTTRRPFEASSVPGFERLHRENPVPEVVGPEPVPHRLAALVRELLAKAPRERPAIDSVVWQLRAIRNELSRRGIDDPLSVLIVDDDRYTTQLFAMYVKNAAPEANITVAHGAKQALEIVRKRPPHIMVLDLIMPEMGGIELFMYLRGERIAEQCNIVAVSVDADASDIALLYELGIAHFLPKDNALQEKLKAIVREYVHCRETGETPRSLRPSSRRMLTNE
jgi:serine/threonine-protein kinase